MMDHRQPTYDDLRAVAHTTFVESIERRSLNHLQAFSFTFDHLAIFIDGDDPWHRLLALTAAFKTAMEAEVELSGDVDFEEHVVDVLRASYLNEAPIELAKRQDRPAKDTLKEDMDAVAARFLR